MDSIWRGDWSRWVKYRTVVMQKRRPQGVGTWSQSVGKGSSGTLDAALSRGTKNVVESLHD